jgi:hypothetical protein
MQDPGNIGWRDYYCIWFTIIGLAIEIMLFQPMLVPFLFGCLVLKVLAQFHKAANLLRKSESSKVWKSVFSDFPTFGLSQYLQTNKEYEKRVEFLV